VPRDFQLHRIGLGPNTVRARIEQDPFRRHATFVVERTINILSTGRDAEIRKQNWTLVVGRDPKAIRFDLPIFALGALAHRGIYRPSRAFKRETMNDTPQL
jgi:hypothetical protein